MSSEQPHQRRTSSSSQQDHGAAVPDPKASQEVTHITGPVTAELARSGAFSSSPKALSTQRTPAQHRTPSEIERRETERERIVWAVSHSVGMDAGPLNPMLAEPLSPARRLPEGGEPVMRKEGNEPMGKRLVDEAKEIGGVVREAIGKALVDAGRKFSKSSEEGVATESGFKEVLGKENDGGKAAGGADDGTKSDFDGSAR